MKPTSAAAVAALGELGLRPVLLTGDAEAPARAVAAMVARDPSLGYADRTFCFLSYGLASWLVARRIPVLEVMYRPMDRGCSSDAGRLFQAPVV